MNICINAKDLVFKSTRALTFAVKCPSQINSDIDHVKETELKKYKEIIKKRFSNQIVISKIHTFYQNKQEYQIKSTHDVYQDGKVITIKKVYDQEDIDQSYFKLSCLEAVLNGAIVDKMEPMRAVETYLHFGNKLYRFKSVDYKMILTYFVNKTAYVGDYEVAKRWDLREPAWNELEKYFTVVEEVDKKTQGESLHESLERQIFDMDFASLYRRLLDENVVTNVTKNWKKKLLIRF